jgi:hypothetical protein
MLTSCWYDDRSKHQRLYSCRNILTDSWMSGRMEKPAWRKVTSPRQADASLGVYLNSRSVPRECQQRGLQHETSMLGHGARYGRTSM